jgi:light-regulated signal transduction histidine kinase (bacteriophytochrome)
LRKILTFSDALIKNHSNTLEETAQTYLKKIHTSANRMNGLIEAVLMYSNVASDKHLFFPVKLNEILNEVLEDLEDFIGSKNATFKIGHMPVVHAIPIQMKQLFQNLISNAIKYSKPSVAPVITISCIEDEAFYKIAVKDNGIGFKNEYAEKIFQVFQRLINHKAYEGTGIGLALCKKIADTHNGKIYAESKEGEGSTFFIHLPKTAEDVIPQPA